LRLTLIDLTVVTFATIYAYYIDDGCFDSRNFYGYFLPSLGT
jgi:hypothetical protein